MNVEMNLSESFAEFEKAGFKGLLKFEELPDISIFGNGKKVIISGKTYDFVNILRMIDGKFKEYKVSFIDEDQSVIEKTVKGWEIVPGHLHIVVNNIEEVIQTGKNKKEKWMVACGKANVKFAKKDTPEYNEVKTIYDKLTDDEVQTYLESQPPVAIVKQQKQDASEMRLKKWTVACEMANVKFAKKGTDDYLAVKSFFDKLTDEEVEKFMKKKEEEKNEMVNRLLAEAEAKRKTRNVDPRLDKCKKAETEWLDGFRTSKGREPTQQEYREFRIWCSVNILGHE